MRHAHGISIPDPAERHRLDSLGTRVTQLMADGAWRTLREIQAILGHTEGGIHARLRALRAQGYTVLCRKRGKIRGLYEYQVHLPGTACQLTLEGV